MPIVPRYHKQTMTSLLSPFASLGQNPLLPVTKPIHDKSLYHSRNVAEGRIPYPLASYASLTAMTRTRQLYRAETSPRCSVLYIGVSCRSSAQNWRSLNTRDTSRLDGTEEMKQRRPPDSGKMLRYHKSGICLKSPGKLQGSGRRHIGIIEDGLQARSAAPSC